MDVRPDLGHGGAVAGFGQQILVLLGVCLSYRPRLGYEMQHVRRVELRLEKETPRQPGTAGTVAAADERCC